MFILNNDLVNTYVSMSYDQYQPSLCLNVEFQCFMALCLGLEMSEMLCHLGESIVGHSILSELSFYWKKAFLEASHVVWRGVGSESHQECLTFSTSPQTSTDIFVVCPCLISKPPQERTSTLNPMAALRHLGPEKINED